MVNKGIFAYLSKLSDEDLDKLVGQVKASRNNQTVVKTPEVKVTAPAPAVKPAKPKVKAVKVKFTDKAEQERLKFEYRSEIEKKETNKKTGEIDQYWVNYYVKKADVVFEVEDGLVEIEKPDIKTSFCFGYGQNGISSEEDSARASRCADAVISDEGRYFKSENLSHFDNLIKELKDESNIFVIGNAYNIPDSRLKRVGQLDRWHRRVDVENGEREMTAKERKTYLEAVKLARANFEKRLDTYLKRYGTSKLRTWSYLVD